MLFYTESCSVSQLEVQVTVTRQKFIVFTNVKTLRSEMQITGVCVCVCVCVAEQIYKP